MTTITTTPETPVVETETIVLPATIAANARELDDVRAVLKIYKEREEALKKNVRTWLDENGLASASDGKVAVFRSEHERSGVNAKALEALYPSVYNDVKTSTPVVQIRVEVSQITG